MKRLVLIVLVTILAAVPLVHAHFAVVIPSTNLVVEQNDATVDLKVEFTHPFSQHYMNMVKPTAFGVLLNGEKQNLLDTLVEHKTNGHSHYTTTYKINRPGDYIFYVEPQPYWEPAEGKYIVHYTKTVVSAFGMEEGWDQMVGFETEIEPLTRPYGLWAGGTFQGRVWLDGKPVPDAEVEITYYNEKKDVQAPDTFHIQVIKADKNGVFTYALPRAGWWGFAALSEAKKPRTGPDGQPKPVEIGAVMWVQAKAME